MAYIAAHWVTGTRSGSLGHAGLVVFLRTIDKGFVQNINESSGMHIGIDSIEKISRQKGGKGIIKRLSRHLVVLEKIDDKLLKGYRALKDINFRTIGIITVDIPRTMFISTEKTTDFNQMILGILSFIGIIAISFLVSWFFRKQEMITRSFERFFPKNLLSLLNKKDILGIHLGDVTERELSVLFLDIRKFTTISEKMTPHENFEFINGFLKYLAPTIKRNHGYIDKYIGDAIMAIFPEENLHADHAIEAAFDLLKELDVINQNNHLKIKHSIEIGIGVNSGPLMIGIVGAEQSLSGTAIGDTVNTASRIEGLTKDYAISLLISESCLRQLQKKHLYIINEVDEVLIRGKAHPEKIYTIHIKST